MVKRPSITQRAFQKLGRSMSWGRMKMIAASPRRNKVTPILLSGRMATMSTLSIDQNKALLNSIGVTLSLQRDI
jgi:hypothetical protein